MSKNKRKYTRKTSIQEPVEETKVISPDEIVPEIKPAEPVIPSFLEPQIVSSKDKDFMAVHDENGRMYNKKDHFIAGKYNHRWKGRKIIHTGRQGIWAVMPKDHPEFKDKVFVTRNDAPEENYFQYEDLVLCVARRESLDSQRVNLRERSRMAIEGSKQDVRAGIERIVKEAKPGMASQIKPIG